MTRFGSYGYRLGPSAKAAKASRDSFPGFVFSSSQFITVASLTPSFSANSSCVMPRSSLHWSHRTRRTRSARGQTAKTSARAHWSPAEQPAASVGGTWVRHLSAGPSKWHYYLCQPMSRTQSLTSSLDSPRKRTAKEKRADHMDQPFETDKFGITCDVPARLWPL